MTSLSNSNRRTRVVASGLTIAIAASTAAVGAAPTAHAKELNALENFTAHAYDPAKPDRRVDGEYISKAQHVGVNVSFTVPSDVKAGDVTRMYIANDTESPTAIGEESPIAHDLRNDSGAVIGRVVAQGEGLYEVRYNAFAEANGNQSNGSETKAQNSQKAYFDTVVRRLNVVGKSESLPVRVWSMDNDKIGEVIADTGVTVAGLTQNSQVHPSAYMRATNDPYNASYTQLYGLVSSGNTRVQRDVEIKVAPSTLDADAWRLASKKETTFDGAQFRVTMNDGSETRVLNEKEYSVSKDRDSLVVKVENVDPDSVVVVEFSGAANRKAGNSVFSLDAWVTSRNRDGVVLDDQKLRFPRVNVTGNDVDSKVDVNKGDVSASEYQISYPSTPARRTLETKIAPSVAISGKEAKLPKGAKFSVVDNGAYATPEWVTVNENTGEIIVQPTMETELGRRTVWVQVTFADGSFNVIDVPITVMHDKDSSQFEFTYPELTIVAGGDKIIFPVEKDNQDVMEGTAFSLKQGQPDWMRVDSDGSLRFQPKTNTELKQYPVVVEIIYPDGSRDETSTNVTVTDSALAQSRNADVKYGDHLVSSGPLKVDVKAGESVKLDAQFVNRDGKSVDVKGSVFETVDGAKWARIDEKTGTFFAEPAATQEPGSHKLSALVRYEDGSYATIVYDVTVSGSNQSDEASTPVESAKPTANQTNVAPVPTLEPGSATTITSTSTTSDSEPSEPVGSVTTEATTVTDSTTTPEVSSTETQATKTPTSEASTTEATPSTTPTLQSETHVEPDLKAKFEKAQSDVRTVSVAAKVEDGNIVAESKDLKEDKGLDELLKNLERENANYRLYDAENNDVTKATVVSIGRMVDGTVNLMIAGDKGLSLPAHIDVIGEKDGKSVVTLRANLADPGAKSTIESTTEPSSSQTETTAPGQKNGNTRVLPDGSTRLGEKPSGSKNESGIVELKVKARKEGKDLVGSSLESKDVEEMLKYLGSMTGSDSDDYKYEYRVFDKDGSEIKGDVEIKFVEYKEANGSTSYDFFIRMKDAKDSDSALDLPLKIEFLDSGKVVATVDVEAGGTMGGLDQSQSTTTNNTGSSSSGYGSGSVQNGSQQPVSNNQGSLPVTGTQALAALIVTLTLGLAGAGALLYSRKRSQMDAEA